MSSVAKIIGYAYLAVWLAGALGLIDMYVCVGAPGSCAAQPQASKVITTSLFFGGAT